MIPPTVKPGAFISFSYSPPQGLASGEPQKEVMVLNPSWQQELHGIDLKRVTPAERMVLQMIMDPKSKENPETIPYPLVRDVLKRLDPIEVVKSPLQFYQMFVKPFIRNKDVYRKYKHQFIMNVKVIKASEVQGPMRPFVPQAAGFKPLFKPSLKGSPFKKQ